MYETTQECHNAIIHYITHDVKSRLSSSSERSTAGLVYAHSGERTVGSLLLKHMSWWRTQSRADMALPSFWNSRSSDCMAIYRVPLAQKAHHPAFHCTGTKFFPSTSEYRLVSIGLHTAATCPVIRKDARVRWAFYLSILLLHRLGEPCKWQQRGFQEMDCTQKFFFIFTLSNCCRLFFPYLFAWSITLWLMTLKSSGVLTSQAS